MKVARIFLVSISLLAIGVVTFAQPRPAQTPRPGTDRQPGLAPGLPTQPRGILTHIPSRAGGEKGIAVRVVSPEKPRYNSGAPVAIAVAGGHSAGNASGRLNVASCGFIEVYFAFPGGGQGQAQSGGTYDYRGPNCILALRDVILFAMGKIADKQGHKIQDLAGNIPVLTSNVGLHGGSHGGNACGAVMGLYGKEFPQLAWYASWESPYGEISFELARRLNPTYDPQTSELDLSKLAYDPDIEVLSTWNRRRNQEQTPVFRGSLFFDLDGDGRYNAQTDYIQEASIFDAGRGPRQWYSVRMIREAEKRNLFGDKRAAHIPTLKEAIEFWRYCEASGLVPDAVRNIPNLAVIVEARETDHVQVTPDHAHIRIQVNGFQKAGARFIRLNPDRAYVEWLLDKSIPGLPDNDAGLQYNWQTILSAVCPDELADGQLLSQAAICELADRVQAGNFEPNLDSVLFPDAPKITIPPMDRRQRPRRSEKSAPPQPQPLVYVTMVSHNETDSRYDRYDTLEGYLSLRNTLLQIAGLVQKYHAAWDFQSDWRFLEAVRKFETADIMSNTNGKNILRYLKEDIGVQTDCHSHEEGGYNYADVAYLHELLGVPPTGVVGGFLWQPPDNPQDWERFRRPLAGQRYPTYKWKANILWGGGTFQHRGEDETSSGIWRPLDKHHFREHDPKGNLIYVAVGPRVGSFAAGAVKQLIQDIEGGVAPPGKMYTVTFGFLELNFITRGQQYRDEFESQLRELDKYAQQGKIQWVTLNEAVSIWQTKFDAMPNIYQSDVQPRPRQPRPGRQFRAEP